MENEQNLPEKAQELEVPKIDNKIGDKFFQSEVTERYDEHKLYTIKCPKCGKEHFRHAGYILKAIPFDDATVGVGVSTTDLPVKICVACKTSIIVNEGKVVDVSDKIDVNAWQETEKQAYKTTGPGGQC